MDCLTVPTAEPETDGTLAWDATPTAGRVVTELLAPAVAGVDPMDVPMAHLRMRRAARNGLLPGLVSAALSAVDVALWDLKARLLGTPLVALLGKVRPAAPVYGSGGFISQDDGQLRDQLGGWVHHDGISRVKIKIGESWGAAEQRDMARIPRRG